MILNNTFLPVTYPLHVNPLSISGLKSGEKTRNSEQWSYLMIVLMPCWIDLYIIRIYVCNTTVVQYSLYFDSWQARTAMKTSYVSFKCALCISWEELKSEEKYLYWLISLLLNKLNKQTLHTVLYCFTLFKFGSLSRL